MERDSARTIDNGSRRKWLAHLTRGRDEDIPEPLPAPTKLPHKPAQRQNEPPSIKLEGEWNVNEDVSCAIRPTAAETDTSGASDYDEDARNRPNMMENVSEHENK